jgi:hypothetical protein
VIVKGMGAIDPSALTGWWNPESVDREGDGRLSVPAAGWARRDGVSRRRHAIFVVPFTALAEEHFHLLIDWSVAS